MIAILEIKGITKRFGGIVALDGCSVSIEENTIMGIIGPNGSGKTTLFDIITGFQRPDSGEVLLKGRQITNFKTYEVSRRGIRRTFQIVRVFGNMSLTENMMVASRPELNYSKLDSDRIDGLLDYVGLLSLKDHPAGKLSFGQQKLLSFAMALATDPEILMLDEPVAGVNPKIIEKMATSIRDLQNNGKTIVIVEHNIPFVMDISQQVVALCGGFKIAQGAPIEIRKDQKVIDSYLGD